MRKRMEKRSKEGRVMDQVVATGVSPVSHSDNTEGV